MRSNLATGMAYWPLKKTRYADAVEKEPPPSELIGLVVEGHLAQPLPNRERERDSPEALEQSKHP